MFKFIHTADVHLDSPLKGLSRYDGAPVDLLRNATRMAFSKLIDIALEEEVSFVIIAGDLYDGTWRDFNTGLFFVSEMNRLHENGIHCYLLYGNHDAESQLTKNLPLPDNVSSFGSRKAQTFALNDIHVALHGQSFKQQETTDNLATSYPEPVANTFNIGVLHTALEGYSAHAAYAPCTLDQLKAKGYNYWALGHVHQWEVLHEDPHIVFPGNLQGRYIREHGKKRSALITVEDNTVTNMEWVYPDVVRWCQLEIDLTSCTSSDEVLSISRERIQQAVEEESEKRTLAIRLIFDIPSKLYSSVISNEADFRAELQALATGNHGDTVWIEQTKYKMSPETDCQTLEEHQDAVYELQKMLEKAIEDDDLIQAINKDMTVLFNLLPPEIKSNPDLELISCLKEKKTGELVEGIIPFLLSSLTKPGEE